MLVNLKKKSENPSLCLISCSIQHLWDLIAVSLSQYKQCEECTWSPYINWQEEMMMTRARLPEDLITDTLKCLQDEISRDFWVFH